MISSKDTRMREDTIIFVQLESIFMRVSEIEVGIVANNFDDILENAKNKVKMLKIGNKPLE